tara:strand:- start:51 stop:308 length:258 start_codon:yes stop_codon:yes gene_type:complete
MNKFKLIQLLNKLELAVGETVMAKKVKENINELILDVKNEAINYTHSCESDSEQLEADFISIVGKEAHFYKDGKIFKKEKLKFSD